MLVEHVSGLVMHQKHSVTVTFHISNGELVQIICTAH